MTWIGQTLVYLVLTQLPFKPRLTHAREISNAINARRIVRTIGRQAFINVLRTVVQTKTGRTFTCVLFSWITACTLILAVLFETQYTTLVWFGGVQLKVIVDQTIFVDVGVRKEWQQIATNTYFTQTSFECFSLVDACGGIKKRT
jgi:hypothetical protein